METEDNYEAERGGWCIDLFGQLLSIILGSKFPIIFINDFMVYVNLLQHHK